MAPPKPKGPHGEPLFKDRECASWGQRVGARLLDWLFMYVIPGIVATGLIAGGTSGLEIAGGVLFGLTALWAFVLYAPMLMVRAGRRNGQTWGKQIVGIRVVRDNGEQFGFGAALLREFVVRQVLFFWIGTSFFGLGWILNYLWPLWDDQNRALQDMIVSTHVVRAEEPATAVDAG
jgi:uncharacterized RDD family membrane protein YckC